MNIVKKLFAVFIVAATIQSIPAAHAVATPTATTSSSSLQQQIDANNDQITQLNQQIATYQAELQQVGANKKTLQAAINALDLQRSKVKAQVASRNSRSA